MRYLVISLLVFIACNNSPTEKEKTEYKYREVCIDHRVYISLRYSDGVLTNSTHFLIKKVDEERMYDGGVRCEINSKEFE